MRKPFTYLAPVEQCLHYDLLPPGMQHKPLKYLRDRCATKVFPNLDEMDELLETWDIPMEVESRTIYKTVFEPVLFAYKRELRQEVYGELCVVEFPMFHPQVFLQFAAQEPVSTALRIVTGALVQDTDFTGWEHTLLTMPSLTKLLNNEWAIRPLLHTHTMPHIERLHALLGDELLFMRHTKDYLLVVVDVPAAEAFTRLQPVSDLSYTVHPLAGFCDDDGLGMIRLDGSPCSFIDTTKYHLPYFRFAPFYAQSQVIVKKRRLRALIAD